MMIENEILKVIRERRSILRFEPEPVQDEKIQAILDAGRWAPSWANSQPWEFIVVKDETRKQKISHVAERVTLAHKGIEGAPAIIVTCVDPRKDSFHFIEDGAVATQNMALAAHSLGLASYWVGIYSPQNAKGSPEREVKEILDIPQKYRVIAFLPIGMPAYHTEKERKGLREITNYDQYGNRPTA
jgi:nitroreductase